jgi:hypothetical protein
VIEGNSKLVFKANKEFYESTGINKKRWSLLYASKVEPKLSELQKIASYFQIPFNAFETIN